MPDADRPDGLDEEGAGPPFDDDDLELVPFRVFALEGDRVVVSLPDVARQNLHALAEALRGQLLGEEGDADLGRLFPPAYTTDQPRDDEYQRLMRDELLAARLGALDVLDATLDAGSVDRAGFDRFLHALNAIRVWLGTRLGVDDDDWEPDPDDERATEIAVYYEVGLLLELALRTLMGG